MLKRLLLREIEIETDDIEDEDLEAIRCATISKFLQFTCKTAIVFSYTDRIEEEHKDYRCFKHFSFIEPYTEYEFNLWLDSCLEIGRIYPDAELSANLALDEEIFDLLRDAIVPELDICQDEGTISLDLSSLRDYLGPNQLAGHVNL